MDYSIMTINTLHIIDGVCYDAKNEELGKIFTSGKSLKEELDLPLTILLEEVSKREPNIADVNYTHPGSIGSGYIVSEAVRKIFDELEIEEAEFLPVVLRGAQATIEGYYFLNIVAKYNCIDRDRSKYRCFLNSNEVSSIQKLAMDLTVVPNGTHIYLVENLKVAAVSKTIKTALESHKITGQAIIPEHLYSD